MDYTKAYTFFAKKQPKSGWNNLLFGVVCQLIPVVGPIVFYGYRIEIARDLEDDPDLLYHRDFDFNKFGEYLGKGVWVFLMQMVGGGIAAVIGAGIGLLAYAVTSGMAPGARMAVGLGTFYLSYFVSILAVVLVLWSLECHLAMAGRFRVSEAFAFAGKFLPLMWKQIVLSVIVYSLAAVILGLVGMLLCFVGIYLVIPVIAMAEGHIIVQLYRQYLEKGGEPVRRVRKYEDDDEGY